jgi:hypothetical protein
MYKPETTFVNGKHPLKIVHVFKKPAKIVVDPTMRLYGKQVKSIIEYIIQNGPVTAAQVVKTLDLIPSAKSQIRDAKCKGLIVGVWGTQPDNNNRIMYYSGVQ